MEIPLTKLTAAALGSLAGLAITRPKSNTEMMIMVGTSLCCAIYLGEDLSKLIPFGANAATFLAGTFGGATTVLLNSIFTRIRTDPLAAIDRLVASWFNRAPKPPSAGVE